MSGTPFDLAKQIQAKIKTGAFNLGAAVPYIDLPKSLKIKSPGQLNLSATVVYKSDQGEKSGEDKNNSEQTLAVNGKIDLKALHLLSGKDTPLFECPHLQIEAESPDIFSKTLLIHQIRLERPRLYVDRDKDGLVNLLALTGKTKSNPKSDSNAAGQAMQKNGKTAGSSEVEHGLNRNNDANRRERNPVVFPVLPFSVKISRAAIENMAVDLNDQSVSPGFATRIKDLDFVLTDIQADTQASGKYAFSIKTEAEERLFIDGRFLLGSDVGIDGIFTLEGLLPEHYRPYFSGFIGPGLTLGKIDTAFDFKAGRKQGAVSINIENGNLGVSNIRLAKDASESALINLDRIEVLGTRADLVQRQVGIGQVSLKGGQINVKRDKAGGINLVTAIEQTLKITPGSDYKTEKKNDGQAETTPWTFILDKADIEDYSIAFSDLYPREPVTLTLQHLTANARNITTKPGEKGSVSLSGRWQDKGKINIGGPVLVSVPSATFDLDVSHIDVESLQPYFTNYLNINISKGQISSKGQLAVTIEENGTQPSITYKGQAAISDFISKNKKDDTEFFTCKSFYLQGMDLAVNPVRVKIKKVALTDFYHRAILSETGQFNLKEILADQNVNPSTGQGDGLKKENSNLSSSSSVADKPERSAPMPDIHIDTITLQGGHINFSDYFTKPNFTANMTEIAGSLSGLSSTSKTPAKLQLKGIHGLHSPLDITGQIDPFKQERFLDMAVLFKNIEMPQFNAYSSKYLGYEIEKGKLILDLKYNIQGNSLSSTNRIFLDQLTLGKPVESEDATSLPIQLAISLLKNSKGEIDLDIPIKGELDDPEFSYADVVMTTFSNFILGVVTAPFKFLGGLIGVGGDTDLGFVEFEPGKDRLAPAEKEKLDSLIGLLNEKQDLKLEIACFYNKVLDTRQLQQHKYESQLLSMLPKGMSGETNGLAGLDEDLKQLLIEAAYANAQFPKPREKSGQEKEIEIGEKQKLLITNIRIDEPMLEQLSTARGKQILTYFTAGEIDPHRIFLIEPKAVPDEEINQEKVKTRFVLK